MDKDWLGRIYYFVIFGLIVYITYAGFLGMPTDISVSAVITLVILFIFIDFMFWNRECGDEKQIFWDEVFLKLGLMVAIFVLGTTGAELMIWSGGL